MTEQIAGGPTQAPDVATDPLLTGPVERVVTPTPAGTKTRRRRSAPRGLPWVATGWLVILAAMAIFGPLFTPFTPEEGSLARHCSPPAPLTRMGRGTSSAQTGQDATS